MPEIVVEIPTEVNEKLFAELKRDIGMIVRLRLARELLLEKWDERFAKSRLSEEDALQLGRKANAAALKAWKERGWL